MELKEGMKAPDFSLKDKDSKVHSLKDSRAHYTIVYFYPKDDTPGCTIEAINFTKELAEFQKLNTAVIGISGGNEASKKTFCIKHNIKITLLSDPSFATCKRYDAYGKKSFIGRSFYGILRKTFVLDKNHRIIKIYEKVNPLMHAQEVLTFIKERTNKE